MNLRKQREICMRKGTLACILALAVGGFSSAFADDLATGSGPRFRPAAARVVLTNAHIARIKSVLKLNAQQETLWPPVEAALREIIRKQRGTSASGEIEPAQLQRLGAAAYPLIMSLGEDQKRSAMVLARAMGLEKLASSF
jgi:hypothetical protein